MLDALAAIANKPTAQIDPVDIKAEVDQSLAYLASQEAMDSLAIDPYWPKWHSPWWHLLLLHELGLGTLIPSRVAGAIVKSLNDHYLKVFPFKEQEVPDGIDPLNQIACHCQLGTIHQVLTGSGINVDIELPWLRPWYLKYQLDDGGLNCDEAAYSRPLPKSSVVSTLPPLEALLNCQDKTAEELECLDRGASYLIDKKLYMRKSGIAIDTEWLKLTFPRFYHYDVLRGLSFLLNWATLRQSPLPLDSIMPVVQNIDDDFDSGSVCIQRAEWQGMNTRYYDVKEEVWKRSCVSTFELLESTGKLGLPSKTLTGQWSQAKSQISGLIELGLIQ